MPSYQSMQAWHSAERFWAARDMEGARRAYEGLLGDRDLRPMAHLRLSQVASNQGRYRDGAQEAIAAFNGKPYNAEVLVALAKQLAMFGESEPALRCATDPTIMGVAIPMMQMEAGSLLASIGFAEESLVLFERARSLGLNTASLSFLIGLNSMYAGDPARAADELEKSLLMQPGMGVAFWALSKLNSGPAMRADWVDRLKAVIGTKKPAADAPLLKYALFRALDDRGETDEAWQALADGMGLRRSQLHFDASQDQALFDHLGSLNPPVGGGFDFEGPQPIFIVGMPRSGTTLLERILGSHGDVRDVGELYDLVWQLRWMCDAKGGPYLDLDLARKAESIDFEELGRRYLSHSQWRARGHAFYIDKMPANYLNISYIMRALPQAKVLHMVRGSMDTCFSNLKECFANGYPHSYDQIEMADHYRRYHALMAHWRTLYGDRILDVRYDDLVTESERVVSEVLEFCGLPWRSGLSAIEHRKDTVVTASAMQVREPIHTRFLQQWRRYETYLQPLRERLGSLAC